MWLKERVLHLRKIYKAPYSKIKIRRNYDEDIVEIKFYNRFNEHMFSYKFSYKGEWL